MGGHAAPARDAATITVDDVLGRLAQIQDPCSVAAGRAMDLVTMGLVGNVDIRDDGVTVSLVLTEPVCWFSKDLIEFATAKLLELPGVGEVVVHLDAETIWTPDRIRGGSPLFSGIPVVSRPG